MDRLDASITTSALAEVVTSSTRSFWAEVYRGCEPPAFGSWVRVEHQRGLVLFGLVSQIEIGSIEPNRRATAFGKTTDELRQEMPHVLALLRATFHAQVLAYREKDGVVRQTLSPWPADIHDFVRPCSAEEVQQLGHPFDFLRTLIRNPDPSVPVDDLIVAVVRNMSQAQEGPLAREEALVQAGRALSRLMNDDHERLHAILRRVA